MMDWSELIISAPAILFGLTVHEFSHGYTAFILGDPTAKQSGRLTLNPLKHLDPLGTILLFLPWTRFGWAKPVPINPSNFKNPLRDLAISSLAGPISNFIVAIFAGIAARILNFMGVTGFAWELTSYFVLINLILCFFNLLPIPPLDGSRLIYYLLPPGLAARYSRLEQYGFLSLLLMFMVGLPLFRMVVFPIVLTTARILLGAVVWF